MTRSALLVSVATLTVNVLADGLPWVGTEIVFGEPYRDTTNELAEPAEASAVRFDAPATLFGETLTMVSPAVIAGSKGAVLNPLAGSGGLLVGFDCEFPTFFANKTRQLLWRGVKLENVSSVKGFLCGSWGGGGKATPDYIFFTKSDDGSMATAQFQAWQINQWTRTVAISLEQDGEDVYATLLWSKFSSEKSSNGKDWILNPAAANAGTHGEYSEYPSTPTANGCGVTDITPVFNNEITLSGVLPEGTVKANLGKLIIAPQSNLSIDSSFTGLVNEVVFRNTLGEWQEFSLPNQWVGTDEILISEDSSIGSVEVLGVYFSGTAINADLNTNPELMENFGVWSDIQGTVRKMQVQYHDNQGSGNNWTKAVNLELRQDGRKVYMKATSTCFQTDDVRGSHIAETSTQPCTAGSPYDRSKCNSGYGLYNLRLRHRSGDWTIKFVGDKANKIVNGVRYTIDGVRSVLCENANAIPGSSSLALTNETHMTLSCAQGVFGTNGGNWFDFIVGSGCVLEASRDWQFGTKARVNAIGGRVTVNKPTYVNWLILADGGLFETKGSGFSRVGYYEGETNFKTLPGSDCTIDAVLIGVKRSVSTSRNIHGFNLGADLHVKRPIADCTEANMFGLNWEKTGPATMYLEASAAGYPFSANTAASQGAFDICEGALACRADSVLSGSNPINLKGGALDAGGFENSFGVLTVSSDSAIALDDGVALAFADSSAAEWTGSLTVNGPWAELSAGKVRFGSSAQALTAEQLHSIRYNGVKCRATLDESGYLVAKPNGTVLLIK